MEDCKSLSRFGIMEVDVEESISKMKRWTRIRNRISPKKSTNTLKRTIQGQSSIDIDEGETLFLEEKDPRPNRFVAPASDIDRK
jgi:hypothetical protein